MLRQLKRLSAALLVFTLLLILSAPQTDASASSYYFTALNIKVLPLTSSTMPLLVKTSRGSTLYIPISLFDSRATTVDLGVYCGGDGKPTATLYSRDKSLTFNLDDGSTFSEDGDQKLCMALWRNGKVYVPASWVCNYFGLNYYLLTTEYGDMVRITNGKEALDNEAFIDAAQNQLQYTLSSYNQTLASNSPASPTTPSGSSAVSPPPLESSDPDSLRVALAFRCSTGDTEPLLNALDELNQKALLLFDPARLKEQADLVRRAAASGHTIGFTLSAGTAEEALDALEEGNRLLRSLCYTRSRVAEIPDASADLLTTLETAGWRCWEGQVDLAEEDDLTSSGLYRTIVRHKDTVRVTLPVSAAELLSSLSARLLSGGHTLYTATESGL